MSTTPLPSRRTALAASALAVGLVAAVGAVDASPSQASNPVAPTATSRSTTVGTGHPFIRPTSIYSTTGIVDDAGALTTGHGHTTLTVTDDGTPASIVLDYGTEVGGQPEFDVTSVSGDPTLTAVYSESLAGLPNGDGGPTSVNVPGDPSRVDTRAVTSAGVIVHPLVQGGERFEQITLTTPGTLTLSAAGIRSTTYQVSHTRGSFASSDAALNQIWKLGSRTVALDMLPAGSQPRLWTISGQGSTIGYTPVNEYQAGNNWTDYTDSFSAKILSGQAGWTVRGQFKLALDAKTDSVVSGSTSLPVGKSIVTGTWYRIKTVVSGATATVYVDGQEVGDFSLPSGGWNDASVGSVGFYNDQGNSSIYRDLTVADGDQTLYASSMTTDTVLKDFDADTNALPVIVDGGKRDRLLWGGDLTQSGLTTLYTNGQSQYVRGTLKEFGAFSRSDGEVSSVLSPLVNIGRSTGDDLVGTGGPGSPVEPGFYSLSYSIHYVGNLYNYYLYTGDKSFLASQWAAVTGEMRYLAHNTDTNGLVVTNAQNGWDWGPHVITGEVTEYNVLYYAALRSAAKMAQALGHPTSAARYAALARGVRTAINTRLFNATTGVYNVSDSITGTYAQDANSMAVLYGVAPAGKVASILATLAAKLHTDKGAVSNSSSTGGLPVVISPFISGFEVEARLGAGKVTSGLNEIRAVWGNMLPGSDTYSGGDWETLGTDGKVEGTGRTLAHAWSSGATWALSRYILGVAPVRPGYKTWSMSPEFGDLTWAKGTVPTPHGLIHASWVKRDGHTTITVTVPRGTTAIVHLRGTTRRVGAGTHSLTR